VAVVLKTFVEILNCSKTTLYSRTHRFHNQKDYLRKSKQTKRTKQNRKREKLENKNETNNQKTATTKFK
jgi:hypothetical protein